MKEIAGALATTVAQARYGTASVRDYLALTKPRHILPSTLTAWIAMALAGTGLRPAGLVASTLAGTALAVASAHVFNALLDRDLDALMERTRDRPLPSGRIPAGRAVLYGSLLGATSLGLMIWAVNGLAALLTLGGILFYVLIYTYWMKRRSPWNTLVGGISGGVPPLIGWAAATGTLDWPAVVLFLIMVVWQPLHFFALSLLLADDYRKAGFPMVVVVHGEQATLNQMVVYSIVLWALSVLLYGLGVTGTAYLATAVVLGAVYVGASLRAARQGPSQARYWGRWLLRYAFLYLTVLLLAAVLDRAV